MTYQLHHGDCLNIMPLIERESVDAIVTDPPYGLDFMGKDWDHGIPGEHFWREAYRCAKPGAHLLAFGGTRTFHRLAVAIEDAGWEIRDTVMWVYGQGFPKSHDVSKAIDKEAGAEREVIGHKGGRYDYSFSPTTGAPMGNISPRENSPVNKENSGFITAPATPLAAQWQGFGTALKPAFEPVIVARKPLVGTVAENVTRYGTGAMNIDGCRIDLNGEAPYTRPDAVAGMFQPSYQREQGYRPKWNADDKSVGESHGSDKGRWPANLIHDGSAEVLAGFPVTSGDSPNRKRRQQFAQPGSNGKTMGNGWTLTDTDGYGDTGSAARFFYCAKASKQDRDEGLEELEAKPIVGRDEGQDIRDVPYKNRPYPQRNGHPCVKPVSLMRYLCRLVTPPNGTILDPFMGSGSTGKAAMLEGFNFIGIDTEIEYVEIAARRIEHACEKVGIVVDQPMMFDTKRETVDKPKQMMLL
jgi:DNA modification methylase